MEASTNSGTSENGFNWSQNPFGIFDYDELVGSFQSFELGKDEQSSVYPSENDAAVDEPVRIINNQLLQETSDTTHSFLQNSVSENIWEYHSYNHRGENNIWKAQNTWLENLGTGSSTRPPRARINYFCGSSSSSKTDYMNQEHDNNKSSDGPVLFKPTEENKFDYYPLIKNYGFNFGIENCTTNSLWSQNAEQYTSSHVGFGPARNLFSMPQVSAFMLMTNKEMQNHFDMFIDECEGHQLKFLVEEILSDPELFIRAAFIKQGSTSIRKLIKKLKKTGYAFTVTAILSTRFCDMMTHQTAKTVIQHCLNLFGNKPNQILYEKAIFYLPFLATHEVGCISLNGIINMIGGDQRMRLLDQIAKISVFLSNDPYGNYVVQHVLELENDSVTYKILDYLQGHFVQLSQKSGGSHVVEKCITSSELGMTTVVEEILRTRRAPFQLARDQFGNYVIQNALANIKKRGIFPLFESLVRALEPYYSELSRTTGGKHVINLLKDDVQLRNQSSIRGRAHVN